MSFVLISFSILTGIGVSLLALNYWHTTTCGEMSDAMKFNEIMHKRLLEAESLSLRNTILLNKVLSLVQLKLSLIEAEELEELSRQSQDEAIKVALQLVKHPSPPKPIFDLDSKYHDSEALADVIDDILENVDDKEEILYDDFKGETQESDKNVKTDEEAKQICNEWKTNYSVVTGVSWGNLPFDLQQKWIEYSCDYHLSDGSESSYDDFVESKESSNSPSSPSSSSLSKDFKDDQW